MRELDEAKLSRLEEDQIIRTRVELVIETRVGLVIIQLLICNLMNITCLYDV